MAKIIKNAARCKRCGMVLESKYRWDFVSCPCGNAVDGGKDYLKRSGSMDDLEELSVWE